MITSVDKTEGFPVGSVVKNLLAMRETRVGSLGREDPLEEGMAIYSTFLAWRIPWTEEPGGLQSMGSQEPDTAERLTLNTSKTVLQMTSISCSECSWVTLCSFHPSSPSSPQE